MHATDTEAAELGAFQLQDVAHIWYETWEQSRGEDAPSATWDEFADAFIEHFMPIEVREAKATEFENLRQKDMTVQDYYLKFVSLSAYAPHMVPDMRAGKCGRKHPGVCRSGTDGCFGCGQQGHYLKDCPSARQNTGGNVAHSTNSAVPRNNQAQQGNNAARFGNTSGGQNRLYALTGRQDTEARTDVVTGTLTVFTVEVYALIDPGSTLPYETPYVAKKFGIELEKLHEPFEVPTPVGESVIARRIYRGCPKIYNVSRVKPLG
ncbi:uncharacterized protein LOC132047526 [Lycium ferocissimum]|uniref:uncharacterized protein LOC132047526 n=1 Tax=Lycium ferocissimum TaxID=112874 RepID=UPI002814CA62|nr:uncharacterized protein LOC132047526 [Lycium ferocissimum]